MWAKLESNRGAPQWIWKPGEMQWESWENIEMGNFYEKHALLFPMLIEKESPFVSTQAAMGNRSVLCSGAWYGVSSLLPPFLPFSTNTTSLPFSQVGAQKCDVIWGESSLWREDVYTKFFSAMGKHQKGPSAVNGLLQLGRLEKLPEGNSVGSAPYRMGGTFTSKEGQWEGRC